MKKIRIHSEAAYAVSMIVLSLAVAMIAATNYGVSMIVAPAYILSLKVPFLTFGQAEYVVQGLLFIVFCLVMKKIKPIYFTAFLTGVIYGAILDIWRTVIPHFDPNVTVPGALPIPVKITYFVLGTVLTSFSVALSFKTYFYPQVYDFFVKGVSGKMGVDRGRFKSVFDFCSLAVSLIMTLLLCRGIKGVGIGTVIMTCVNGVLIGFFDRFFDRHVDFVPAFGRFSKLFEI